LYRGVPGANKKSQLEQSRRVAAAYHSALRCAQVELLKKIGRTGRRRHGKNRCGPRASQFGHGRCWEL